MNSLELQEKTIYTYLLPFLSEQGYHVVNSGTVVAANTTPGIFVPGKEFRKNTSSGFKSVMFSFSHSEDEQVLYIHLGIRLNMIESLVSQFLGDAEDSAKQPTIMASLHKFNRPPLPKLLLTDEHSLKNACKQIGEFMQKKGFRFLNTFENVKRIDSALNRKPFLPSPYLQNQFHRCFKGITTARLLHRTNFEALCSVYHTCLQNQKAPESVLENYQKLVSYLKCFSFN